MVKKEVKIIQTFAICSILVLLSVGFVSAGFFDWITGRATNQDTDVSVQFQGTNQAQIVSVDGVDASYNPTENSATTITFSVIVADADGVNDINDSSVTANFSSGSDPTRFDSSDCSLVSDLNSTAANFTCTIDMYYYDNASTWTVNIGANDLGNGTADIDSATSFTYSQLKAMVISPASLAWSTLSSGATNEASTTDPTIINNTGNYDATVNLTGIDLRGETNSTDLFAVPNFTVHRSSGSECSGQALSNGTAIVVTSSDANRGNLSSGAGAGQETFYYCIPSVPSLPTQIYSTTATGGISWTISY